MSDKTAFQPGDIIFGVKATGSDGLSFASQYTDGQRIDYAGSIGQDIEVKAAGAAAGQCAAGIHFSLRAIDCCRAMRGSGDDEFASTMWVMGDYVVTLATRIRPHSLVEIHDRMLAQNMRGIFKSLWNN
jgi:hypothetical protein